MNIIHIYIYMYIYTHTMNVTQPSRKEWSHAICNMDGAREYYAKQNKLEKTNTIWFHSYAEFKKLNEQRDKKETHRDTWVAQRLSVCLRLRAWPWGPGSSPTSDSWGGPASPSACVSASLCVCLSWINKSFLKKRERRKGRNTLNCREQTDGYQRVK